MAYLSYAVGKTTFTMRNRRRVGVLAFVLLSGLLLGACGAGADPGRTPAAVVAAQPTELPAPAPLAQGALAALPESTTFTSIAHAVADPAPGAATDGTVLRITTRSPVYDRPDGAAFAVLPPTELGSPTWVPIIDRRPGWSRVLLPSRPDSSTGWVYTGADTHPQEAHAAMSIDVDVTKRHLVLRKDNQDVGDWSVGVGKPNSPTPLGRTFIMASIRETVTHFSPIILPLGTHSNTFDSYGGGPGTVALHGWPDKSKIGTASSDGCIRVSDDLLHLLTTLPLGTLVVVH